MQKLLNDYPAVAPVVDVVPHPMLNLKSQRWPEFAINAKVSFINERMTKKRWLLAGLRSTPIKLRQLLSFINLLGY